MSKDKINKMRDTILREPCLDCTCDGGNKGLCNEFYKTYSHDLDELLENPPFGNQDVAAQRKATPIYSGVLMYFPDAIKAIAQCSQRGNDQHHADKPLHWDRAKSGDELDALTRHLMAAGTLDTDGIRHSAKVAWRALANLQKEIERENM